MLAGKDDAIADLDLCDALADRGHHACGLVAGDQRQAQFAAAAPSPRR